MVHPIAEDFAQEISRLCQTIVRQDQWAKFLNAYVSRYDAQGIPLNGRALTMADNERDTLQRLYGHDDRIRSLGGDGPWGLGCGEHLRAPRKAP